MDVTDPTSRALARYPTIEGATTYAGKFRRTRWKARTHRREVVILAAFLRQIGPIRSLLNLPCGTGRFSDVLEARGRPDRVVYADDSPAMLGQARENLAAGGGTIPELKRLDVTRDELDETFDLVLCVRLLHHLKSDEDRRRALSFLTRAARDALILTVASTSTWRGWSRARRARLGRRRGGESIVPLSAVARELDDLGFRVERIAYVHRLFSSQTWVLARRCAPAAPVREA